MKNIFEKIIQELKQNTTLGNNPVETLINIVPMSKEAAYRRLRGEIDFSFNEIVKITQRLNISLDNLIEKTHEDERYDKELASLNLGSLGNKCYQSTEELISLLKIMKKKENPHIFALSNILLPFAYIYKYDTMAKFRLYRWTCQWEDEVFPQKMENFIVADSIHDIKTKLCKELQTIAVSYVCQPNFLNGFIHDIKYFQRINLVSNEEVGKLKNETFSFLDDLERDLITGKSQAGSRISFYVCNTSLDSSYLLLKCNEFETFGIRLFGLTLHFMKDPKITSEIKNWIQTMIKHSTLISVSGEKQRFEFFKKQREFINAL